MTTVDGGALCLKRENEFKEAKKLRWFGLDKSVSRLKNDIKRPGYKYGMNNVTAAMGKVQLKHMETIIGKHIENGKYYDEKLKGIPGITLIPYYEYTEPSYWLYTLKVEQRTEFMKALEDKGITASPLHHRSDTHSVFKSSLCVSPG